MRDLFEEIWSDIRRNKLRTILTGFAVAWGIFMLIFLLGAGNGLIHALESNNSDYEAKSNVHYKSMRINCEVTKQENNLFTATITWKKIKECSYYELYQYNEDGKEELLLSVDDGNYTYTVSDLIYGDENKCIIYGYKEIDGNLIKTYYADFSYDVIVSPVYRYIPTPDVVNAPKDHSNTSKSKVSIDLKCNSFQIDPEYIEVIRVNKLTGGKKTFKIGWDELEKERDRSFKYNIIYTDDTVKANQVYEYTFKPYIILNGKKCYSSFARTYTFASYNSIASCDFDVTHNTKNNTFLVKIKSQDGNAPIMINTDYITHWQAAVKPMKLTQISYDGTNYIQAKKGLYLFLKQNETLYMKFKGNDRNEISFRLYFKYFYDPNDEENSIDTIVYINKKSSRNKQLIPAKEWE